MTIRRTADRNYINEFVLSGKRALGKKYGVDYAEAFHYIGGSADQSAVDKYVEKTAVSTGK